ncbi:MAG: contractile injection system protein, VgrG/Pvc8 family [Paracoccus sp. (in: a-proteobacteria)]|nr:contractile injection system protein, VgrG/Pvc8 family [Paracoccus sp. (in: a-proteobacteria)]
MRPAFLILVDGADVTAQFQDRLVSLTVTDNDGEEADQVEITVDDRGGRVSMPALDARLEVFLGWHGQPLSMMGVFAVDGVSGEGPVETLTISATAADMKGPIRNPKTRGWQDVTLADIARTIAAEAGLEAVLSPSLAGRAFPYVAQTAESDLHLITRLARPFNATAKPAGGRLIVQRRGEPATAAGDAMPSGAITRADLTGWNWRLETRGMADRIEAEYTAPDAGMREIVSAGEGDSSRRLRHVFTDRASALDAAEGELARGRTTAMTCSAELASFRPDIIAGARAVLAGISEKIDGDWQVKKVEHRLEGALLTGIELTKGAAG